MSPYVNGSECGAEKQVWDPGHGSHRGEEMRHGRSDLGENQSEKYPG